MNIKNHFVKENPLEQAVVLKRINSLKMNNLRNFIDAFETLLSECSSVGGTRTERMLIKMCLQATSKITQLKQIFLQELMLTRR